MFLAALLVLAASFSTAFSPSVFEMMWAETALYPVEPELRTCLSLSSYSSAVPCYSHKVLVEG